MADVPLHVITVAMSADGSRSGLLSMASVLHRRGVDVVEADMARPSQGRRVFSATFRADARVAGTVLSTFVNLIDVVDASLFEALDSREPRVGAPVRTTV